MPHATLSASASKRWRTCWGSAALTSMQKTQEQSDYAMEGSCAHFLIEYCLQLNKLPAEYQGQTIQIRFDKKDIVQNEPVIVKNEAEPDIWFAERTTKKEKQIVFSTKVESAMINATTVMVEYVRSRCKDLFGIDNTKTLLEQRLLYSESRVNPFPARADTGGTADVIIDAWPTVLEIVDYKNGAGVFVSPERNDQLRSYALGALHYTATENDDSPAEAGYDNILTTIVQPNHPDSPPGGVMSERLTIQTLLEWSLGVQKDLVKVGEAFSLVKQMATENDGEIKSSELMDNLLNFGLLNVGEYGRLCKDTFCPYMAECPAVKKAAYASAKVDFSEFPPEGKPAKLLEHVPIQITNDMSADEVGRLLKWVPMLNAIAKAYKTNAETRLMQGKPVTGFKLVAGRSNRTWADIIHTKKGDIEKPTDNEIADGIIDDGFVKYKKELFNEPSLKTPKQIEDLMKGDLKKEYSKNYLIKPPGSPTIVPEDDPKPAIVIEPGFKQDETTERFKKEQNNE